MEEDRLETNLGPTADDNLAPESQAQKKQPKRRFVGRRTAEQLKETSEARSGGDVEGSSLLQGLRVFQ
jgi:2-(3-amino-3-carboxypropyl)histidine synthase